MTLKSLRFASFAVLLLLVTHAAGKSVRAPGAVSQERKGSIIPGKDREVQQILSNPPTAFSKLMDAVPFTIYGKDKSGNYVAFCDSKLIKWNVVNDMDSQAIVDYIKFVALFFWTHVDQRADSSLTVVVNADGFSLSKVISGSVKTVLDSITTGLDATVPYVGERSGKVFIINSPSFLSPVIAVASKLVRNGVELSSYSSREQWEPALKAHIGDEYLPAEYGGKNLTKLSESSVVRFMKSAVRKILKEKRVARAMNAKHT